MVVDLSPGLHGVAFVMLKVFAHLHHAQGLPEGYPEVPDGCALTLRPHLVVTADRNDIGVGVEGYLARIRRLDVLGLVVNRSTEGREMIRRLVDDHYAPIFGREPTGVVDAMRIIDEHAALGALFRVWQPAAAHDYEAQVAHALRLDTED